MISTYDFARWFHVLLMGYWLGAEFVINAWSWYFARAKHMTYAQRMEIWDMVIDTDQHVRNALILIMPFGFQLAAELDLSPVKGDGLVAVWIVSLAWFALMWMSHLTLKKPSGKFWRDLDLWVRTGVAVFFIGLGLYSLAVGTPIGAGWLSAKLVFYGLTIMCGISIRHFVRKVYAVMPAYAQAGTSNPEIEAGLMAGIRGATWVIVGLWACAFVAGYLGAAKPF